MALCGLAVTASVGASSDDRCADCRIFLFCEGEKPANFFNRSALASARSLPVGEAGGESRRGFANSTGSVVSGSGISTATAFSSASASVLLTANGPSSAGDS